MDRLKGADADMMKLPVMMGAQGDHVVIAGLIPMPPFPFSRT